MCLELIIIPHIHQPKKSTRFHLISWTPKFYEPRPVVKTTASRNARQLGRDMSHSWCLMDLCPSMVPLMSLLQPHLELQTLMPARDPRLDYFKLLWDFYLYVTTYCYSMEILLFYGFCGMIFIGLNEMSFSCGVLGACWVFFN